MSSPWIAGLRSVALNVPDLDRAEQFYTQVWRLEVAGRTDDALYLRGTGSDAYLLALHRGSGEVPQIRHVTLRAHSRAALDEVRARAVAAGASIVAEPQALAQDPAGGTGLTLRDPHGRVFQVVYGDAYRDASVVMDCPQRLTHVVLNSHAVEETQRFLIEAFGFRLADRTGIMAFMNCGSDHHTIAVGITDNDALNHIAFLMPDGDAVMRGGGRMKDGPCHPVGPGPPRAGQQPVQLLHRSVRHRHRIHRRGRADRRQLPGAHARRLEVAARPRRPVGYFGAARRRTQAGAEGRALRLLNH